MEEGLDRRHQFLNAAQACFSRRGFHQTTIQDISDEAGVSVGLLYRYFPSKDAVIEAMAEAHKGRIAETLERAREAGSLREALEAFFLDAGKDVEGCARPALVVDLFAEASRNSRVADCVSEVMEHVVGAMEELIGESGETLRLGISSRRAAELLVAFKHGLFMRDAVMGGGGLDHEGHREALEVLSDLLFGGEEIQEGKG